MTVAWYQLSIIMVIMISLRLIRGMILIDFLVEVVGMA